MLICACGAFALIGFPLDDVWHRLFGQDVTLWGPTHLMLIGGAAMTLVGIAVLLVEGQRALKAAGKAPNERALDRTSCASISLTGGLLLGLSTFQAEFDFGVAAVPASIFHPMLIMLAAGVALVAARIWLGRGAALGAVAFFLLIRGVLALLVGPVLGETTPHFPLYLGSRRWSSSCVAAVRSRADAAARLRRLGRRADRHRRPRRRVGLVAQVWMPLPWTARCSPRARCSASPPRSARR